MTFALVVKVKHGESVRRLNIYADKDGYLHLDLDGLKARILNLLKISPETDVTLTYLDEDGDIITLADEYDLSIALSQRLNPLRITLQLNQDGTGKSKRSKMVSSTQSMQHVLSNMKSTLSGFLEFMSTKVPETVRRVIDSTPSRSSPSGSSSEPCSDSSSETIDSTPSRDSCHSFGSRSGCCSSSSSESCSDCISEIIDPTPSRDSSPSFSSRSSCCSDESFNAEKGKKDEKFSCFQNAESSYHSMEWLGTRDCAAGYGLPETPGSNNLPCAAARGSSATGKRELGLNRRTIHEGVQCKNCLAYPITGPRFKSRTKDDFDLCHGCFMSKGSNGEFVRLKHPDSLPVPQSANMWPARFNSLFMRHITVEDGTKMKAGSYFTKIWRMFNSGTMCWPSDTQLKWIGGHKLTHQVSVQVASPYGVCSHDEIDIAIKFKAPQRSGRYASYWRLSLPSGKQFGDMIWVDIQVVDPYEDYKLDLCSLQSL